MPGPRGFLPERGRAVTTSAAAGMFQGGKPGLRSKQAWMKALSPFFCFVILVTTLIHSETIWWSEKKRDFPVRRFLFIVNFHTVKRMKFPRQLELLTLQVQGLFWENKYMSAFLKLFFQLLDTLAKHLFSGFFTWRHIDRRAQYQVGVQYATCLLMIKSKNAKKP